MQERSFEAQSFSKNPVKNLIGDLTVKDKGANWHATKGITMLYLMQIQYDSTSK